MEEIIRREADLLAKALHTVSLRAPLLQLIEPRKVERYERTGSHYVEVATFGANRPRISVWYDGSLDENRLSFWVGFGAADRKKVDDLLRDCLSEFPSPVEFPVNDYEKDEQQRRLRDEALKEVLAYPVTEFWDEYALNGFGIYGEPGRDTLDLKKATDFIAQVWYCLPEYRVPPNNALQTSIWAMANQAEQTARNSNGQTVVRTVTVKNKEVLMTHQELEEHIEHLLIAQENKCAMTGINLQFHGAQNDNDLLPSLDRIDSEGHYKKGNLQVVCRFINFWKSATPNHEFKRLLRLVIDVVETWKGRAI